MSNPSNKTNWYPVIPVGQSIYEESTTQETMIGTEIVVGDRKFRYAAAATNLTAGNPLVSPISTQVNKSTAAVAGVGTFEVAVYSTVNIASNVFAEGYLTVMDSTGEGIAYKIRRHAALTATTVSQKVVLYDALASGGNVTAVSKLSLVPNPYAAMWAGTEGNATAACFGIAPIAVTSGNYFWAAVEGPVGVRCAGALTYGSKAAMGTTGGAIVVDATANATCYIGTVLSVTGTALDTVLTWVGKL